MGDGRWKRQCEGHYQTPLTHRRITGIAVVIDPSLKAPLSPGIAVKPWL